MAAVQPVENLCPRQKSLVIFHPRVKSLFEGRREKKHPLFLDVELFFMKNLLEIVLEIGGRLLIRKDDKVEAMYDISNSCCNK